MQVFFSCIAIEFNGCWLSDNVSRLEIFNARGFFKHQILGERFAVITYMHTRKKYMIGVVLIILAVIIIIIPVALQPPDTGLNEVLRSRSGCHARVAFYIGTWTHIPC